MVTIKNRFTSATLCELNVETIKHAVEKAAADKIDLSGADLYDANLDGANLYGADLSGADLSGADLDGEKLTKSTLSITGLRYWCLISDGFMRLGCKRFSHSEWESFDDKQISEMDSGALEFWNQWKTPLLEMCKTHASKSK